MSIILKALKKIQEQEADQALSPSLGEASPDEGNLPVTSSSSYTADVERSYIAHAPEVPRYAFGLGLRALLGLLIVLGIATTGWFANRIYSNLRAAPETAPATAPVIAQKPAKVAETAISSPMPAEPALAETVSATAPPVVEKPVASQAVPPQPVIAAVTPAPIEPQPLEPKAANVASAQPVQPAPARPPIVIEVPAVESSASAPSVPVMKEARPAKAGRPELKINAIAWKNDEPRAIVNMQRVYEGDVIEGATVVAIKRKVIVFEYDGEIFEVRF